MTSPGCSPINATPTATARSSWNQRSGPNRARGAVWMWEWARSAGPVAMTDRTAARCNGSTSVRVCPCGELMSRHDAPVLIHWPALPGRIGRTVTRGSVLVE